MKSRTLYVNEFALERLEASVELEGVTAAVLVRAAVLYYLSERDSGRTAWAYPGFARGEQPEAREVQVDEEIAAALEVEADRQEVEPSELVGHACLYLLADLDSGRLAGRLASILEDL